MLFFRRQLERTVGNQLPTLLLAICVGVSGAALLIVPSVRLAENVDSGPLNERNEQSTAAERRLCLEKSLRSDAQRSSFAVSTISNVRQEQFQCTGQHAPDGHRLPNGLLAPLTC